MVAHQYIGVDRARVAAGHLAQGPEVGASILIVEKAGHAIVAALDDVLGDTGNVGSWESGHRAECSPHDSCVLSAGSVTRVGNCRSKAL